MLNVLLFLLGGLFLGWLSRNRKGVLTVVEQMVTITIYILLFTLGLKAGGDTKITSQLHTLGFRALLISIFAVSGSIFVTWVYARVFLKKDKE